MTFLSLVEFGEQVHANIFENIVKMYNFLGKMQITRSYFITLTVYKP